MFYDQYHDQFEDMLLPMYYGEDDDFEDDELDESE